MHFLFVFSFIPMLTSIVGVAGLKRAPFFFFVFLRAESTNTALDGLIRNKKKYVVQISTEHTTSTPCTPSERTETEKRKTPGVASWLRFIKTRAPWCKSLILCYLSGYDRRKTPKSLRESTVERCMFGTSSNVHLASSATSKEQRASRALRRT